jgi:hypothetical protein
MNHLINIHPERSEILLVPHGLTKSERNLFNDQGYYSISLKNGEEDEKLNYICPSMDYSDFKKSDEYKKIILVKNPYWRILRTYLRNYIQLSGEKKDVIKHFKSFVNRLVLNENFQEWEEQVRRKIRSINLPEFDEVIHLESIDNPDVIYFDMIRTQGSNYLWSIENYSDFYDIETAEIVFQKNKDYFERFNYTFYSYLDFYNPIEKIHVLHGKQTNIFHL